MLNKIQETFKNKGRTKDISSKYNKAEMAILINEDNYLKIKVKVLTMQQSFNNQIYTL